MKSLAFVFAAAMTITGAASAETLTVRVGYSPGGSYDAMARLVADHLGAHLAGNPQIVVENAPGAGSLKLAKLMMADTSTDGQTLYVVSSGLALKPVFEPDSTDFDPRAVHYIAAMAKESSYCVTPKASGIETLDQLLRSGAKVGATGKSSTTYTFAAGIKAAFDANMEIVTGFEGGEEIDLAMERGDLQGRCGISAASIKSGGMLERFNVVAELGIAPSDSGLGGEFLLDRVTDAAKHDALALVFSSSTVHHPIIAGPATSSERVAELRAAFDAMVADDAFLTDAKARGAEFSYTPGVGVEEKIGAILTTDPAIQDLARQMVE